MALPALAVQVNGQGTVTADNLNTYQGSCNVPSDLRSFVGISGMQVYMRGYTSPGDGGQGIFYWNATGTAPDDNGVTTIVPSSAGSGEWTRLSESINTVSTLTVENNATIGGTLSVTGNTTLSGNLTVDGVTTLTGTVTFPTQSPGNNSTDAATTAYVDTAKNFNFAVITTTGTFTTPSTINSSTVFKITLVGGGGGGGGTNGGSNIGQGGGAGGIATIYIAGLAASTAYTVTIGGGGSAGSAAGGNGGGGGGTSIVINAVTYTVTGGAGGLGQQTGQWASAAQGTANSSITSLSKYLLGYQTPAVGCINSTSFGCGGASTSYGTGGLGDLLSGGSATAGTGYGSGGGAGLGSTSVGAAGAAGLVTIEWVF